jgi:hypothetical protein
MSSPLTNETLIAFTMEQFLTLLISILVAIGGAVWWITHKVTKVGREDRGLGKRP